MFVFQSKWDDCEFVLNMKVSIKMIGFNQKKPFLFLMKYK
jgi:hypothetical protein